MALFRAALRQWGLSGRLSSSPAYESLKAAMRGLRHGPGVRPHGRADLLIGFGADFLETWLSPVEYAQKFKAMHALRNGKGFFSR